MAVSMKTFIHVVLASARKPRRNIIESELGLTNLKMIFKEII